MPCQRNIFRKQFLEKVLPFSESMLASVYTDMNCKSLDYKKLRRLAWLIMYFKIVMNIGTFQERKKNWDKMRRMWARTS